MIVLDAMLMPNGQKELDKINRELALVILHARIWPFLLGSALLTVIAGIVANIRRGFSAAILLVGAIAGPVMAAGPLFTLEYPGRLALIGAIACLGLPLFLALFFVRQASPAELALAAERRAFKKAWRKHRSRADEDRNSDRGARRSRTDEDGADDDDFNDPPQRS